jgi:hypothetical protein
MPKARRARRTVRTPAPPRARRPARRVGHRRSSFAAPDPALPSIVPGSIPAGSEGTALPRVDRPHSQAVCRGCGRIVEVPLALEELRALAGLADRAPEGWRVDGLSFTLMGACRRCREGPAA